MQSKLYKFSIETLDFVVDYTSYFFLPALALVISDLTNQPGAIIPAFTIVISSALYFADKSMKTQSSNFHGFPCVWNGVLFSMFVLRAPWRVSTSIVLIFSVLDFLTVDFIHAVRLRRWRKLTLPITIAWFMFAIISLWYFLSPDILVKVVVTITVLYLLSVAAVSNYRDTFLK